MLQPWEDRSQTPGTGSPAPPQRSIAPVTANRNDEPRLEGFYLWWGKACCASEAERPRGS